jgi:DNA-binding response OmpR family regulator
MTKKILVIDDEPDLLDIVRLMLKQDGYEILTARDGADGLEILAQQPVDLIILDIMMPAVDGWEVLRQLTHQDKTNSIPVILLTAKAQPIDKMLGLKVFGVREYITKPFEMKDLQQKVANILG